MTMTPVDGFPLLAIQQGTLERFCEVHFEGDSRYKSIELQKLAFVDGRAGHAITMWTADDRLDFFYEKSLEIDQRWLEHDPAYAHLRTGQVEEVEMTEAAVFPPTAPGCRVKFRTPDGRNIEYSVSVKTVNGRSLRAFVPPTNHSPIRGLRHLFVQTLIPLRPTDQVLVRIDGVSMTPKRWPWPIALRKHLQARYGDDVTLFNLVAGVDSEAVRRADPITDVRSPISTIGSPIDSPNGSPIETRKSGSDLELLIDKDRVAKLRYEAGQVLVEHCWRPPLRSLSLVALEAMRRLRSRNRCWSLDPTAPERVWSQTRHGLRGKQSARQRTPTRR